MVVEVGTWIRVLRGMDANGSESLNERYHRLDVNDGDANNSHSVQSRSRFGSGMDVDAAADEGTGAENGLLHVCCPNVASE